jgi:hypothetical protein
MAPTKTLIWDLQHPGCKNSCGICGDQAGPAQILMWSTDAGDALERAPTRYVRELPEGVQPGPHTGADRLIH